jgi:hypothetical protein
MKLLGAKKLARQLSDLPDTVRGNIGSTIEKQVKRGVRVARTLVPVDTGQLKGWITGRVEKTDNGVYGIIDAAPDTKKAQQKARAVEFGRTKGNRGTTAAQPYIRTTQSFLAKSYRSAVKRAINKAAKEAVRG